MRVLLVEDDKQLASALRRGLEAEGYAVDGALTGTDGEWLASATMNAMLERLDLTAQRQRNFVADVSHDLQSPLAAQQVALEVALASPEGVDTAGLREEVLGA